MPPDDAPIRGRGTTARRVAASRRSSDDDLASPALRTLSSGAGDGMTEVATGDPTASTSRSDEAVLARLYPWFSQADYDALLATQQQSPAARAWWQQADGADGGRATPEQAAQGLYLSLVQARPCWWLPDHEDGTPPTRTEIDVAVSARLSAKRSLADRAPDPGSPEDLAELARFHASLRRRGIPPEALRPWYRDAYAAYLAAARDGDLA